ncbi:MAG: hypothetical protein LBB63_03480 [Holosporaceae bacterium]|nr:hypothetical protein [Holosporaceae bacterium]
MTCENRSTVHKSFILGNLFGGAIARILTAVMLAVAVPSLTAMEENNNEQLLPSSTDERMTNIATASENLHKSLEELGEIVNTMCDIVIGYNRLTSIEKLKLVKDNMLEKLEVSSVFEVVLFIADWYLKLREKSIDEMREMSVGPCEENANKWGESQLSLKKKISLIEGKIEHK